MVDVVKYEKLDLIHVHYAIPHASAAFMAKQILATQGISIPFVTTLHGTDITLVGRDPSFEPVITFCINQSDAVTAVSESLKADTLKHFDVKNDIYVIPNFIRLNKSSEKNNNEEIRELYANKDERILCHISNFRKVKRVEDVIRIFAKVVKTRPSKLIFVGDGPERYHCEMLCRELSFVNIFCFSEKRYLTCIEYIRCFYVAFGNRKFWVGSFRSDGCWGSCNILKYRGYSRGKFEWCIRILI